jgi:hypothetical protein
MSERVNFDEISGSRPFKAKIEGSNPSRLTSLPGFFPRSCRSRVSKSICRAKRVRSRGVPRLRSASNPNSGYVVRIAPAS